MNLTALISSLSPERLVKTPRQDLRLRRGYQRVGQYDRRRGRTNSERDLGTKWDRRGIESEQRTIASAFMTGGVSGGLAGLVIGFLKAKLAS